MVKFCPKCGSPVNEAVKFCPKCGSQLPASSSQNITQSFEQQASHTANQNQNMPPPPPPQNNMQRYQNQPQNIQIVQQQQYTPPPPRPSQPRSMPGGRPPKKPRGKLIVGIIAVVIVIAIVLALFVFVFSEKTGTEKAKEVATEFMDAYNDANWEKVLSMQMRPDGSLLTQKQISENLTNIDDSSVTYVIKNFEILNVTKLDYSVKHADELYKVGCEFKVTSEDTDTGETHTSNTTKTYLYVGKNKNNDRWGVSFSKFCNEDEEDNYYGSSPTLAISQNKALGSTGNYWVNFTVYSASADAKWNDLKILIDGVDFGTPANTNNPTVDHCGQNSAGDSVKAGDTLYCHSSSIINPGDMIQVKHMPSNAIILQKTIV